MGFSRFLNCTNSTKSHKASLESLWFQNLSESTPLKNKSDYFYCRHKYQSTQNTGKKGDGDNLISLISRGRLMNRKKGAAVRSLFRTNRWKGCVRTSGNFEKPTKKKHESKVNYLKIFLAEFFIYNLSIKYLIYAFA